MTAKPPSKNERMKREMNDSMKNGCCKDHIKGINCAVKNCAYHDGECYCTAERIHVGPANAHASSETVCATFKPEQK